MSEYDFWEEQEYDAHQQEIVDAREEGYQQGRADAKNIELPDKEKHLIELFEGATESMQDAIIKVLETVQTSKKDS